MDWLSKKLAEVDNEMGAAAPAGQTQPAAGGSGLNLDWLQQAGQLASSATDHLKDMASTAASAATELALREELERKAAEVVAAEDAATVLRQELHVANGQLKVWKKTMLAEG